MSKEKECLEWLESLDTGYIGDRERQHLEDNYPDVEFNLTGVTSHMRDGEIKTPIRDYIDSLKYGKPLD